MSDQDDRATLHAKHMRPVQIESFTEASVIAELPCVDQAEDAESASILATFDDRLNEAERRIDRVLARLGVQ